MINLALDEQAEVADGIRSCTASRRGVVLKHEPGGDVLKPEKTS